MSLEKNETMTNEASYLSIKDLGNLVKDNKLDQIKEIILHEKAASGTRWMWVEKNDILCAVRDAILLGQLDTVQFFLDQGLSPNVSIFEKGSSGYLSTLISFAAESGNLSMVKLLVSYGANISPQDHRYDQGDDSAMRMAVIKGHAEIVDYLLENGAQAEAFCNGGCFGELYGGVTFLAKAAQDENIHIVESLLSHGASIRGALRRAHEKFEHASENYDININKYRKKRKDKLSTWFGYFYDFNVNFQKKSEVNIFFDYLNKSLVELDMLNEVKKNQILEKLTSFFTKNSIIISKNKVSDELEAIVKVLLDLDHKYNTLKVEFDEFKNSYERMTKILLDYAIGNDFYMEKNKITLDDGLNFLRGFDISGFNFIGVSIGYPITHEMLLERGFKNANKALVSLNDLINLKDIPRRQALTLRLEKKIQEQGMLISNIGIVNLVPLSSAAEMGDITAVKVRLKAGVDPNEGKFGITPIVLAAKNGHFEIVKMLAEHPQIDKKMIIEAIEVAGANHLEEIVDYLSTKRDVNEVDSSGETHLYKAIAIKDVKQVQALINRGANVNLPNKNQETPLLKAAALTGKEGTAIVELLLENGADAKVYYWRSASECISPLYLAISSGNSETLELLLSHSKKIGLIQKNPLDEEDKDNTPWYVDLMFCALIESNDTELLSLLKAYGADFNTKNQDGDTLLIHTIGWLTSCSDFEDILPKDILQQTENTINESRQKNFKKCLSQIDFLLSNGADPVLANKKGYTPLHLLIKEGSLPQLKAGYIKFLDRLLHGGADVNAKTSEDMTILHVAADVGDLIALEYLVSKGASINAKTKSGKTPLHFAVGRGFLNTVEYLKRNGADVNIADENNLTPFDLSKKVEKELPLFRSQDRRSWTDKCNRIRQVLTKSSGSNKDGLKKLASLDINKEDMEITNSNSKQTYSTGNKVTFFKENLGEQNPAPVNKKMKTSPNCN